VRRTLFLSLASGGLGSGIVVLSAVEAKLLSRAGRWHPYRSVRRASHSEILVRDRMSDKSAPSGPLMLRPGIAGAVRAPEIPVDGAVALDTVCLLPAVCAGWSAIRWRDHFGRWWSTTSSSSSLPSSSSSPSSTSSSSSTFSQASLSS